MVQGLSGRLFRMQKEDQWTDVTFVVNGHKINGHRVIMSSHGGPMQKLLLNNPGNIKIDDMGHDTFDTLLGYVAVYMIFLNMDCFIFLQN